MLLPIKRAEHKKDFTIILNTVLNDIRLSYGARGLIAHVLTHYDNWVFTGEDYFVTNIDKKTKIRGYIKELIALGYLKRYREQDEKGKLGNSIYTFFEIPNCEMPNLENPNLEKPNLENQKQAENKNNEGVQPNCDLPNLDYLNLGFPNLENLNVNNTNNINNINNIYSSNLAEEIWKAYPNKKGKAKSMTYINKILKSISKEELLRCIDRYKKDVENQRANGFKTLAYKHGLTFFNGGYIDYLDKNYQEENKDIEEGNKEQTIEIEEFLGGKI